MVTLEKVEIEVNVPRCSASLAPSPEAEPSHEKPFTGFAGELGAAPTTAGPPGAAARPA